MEIRKAKVKLINEKKHEFQVQATNNNTTKKL